MSSVDWQRVKSVFHEVLERDGEARAALRGRRVARARLYTRLTEAPRA